jgi:hypothetical protein
MHPEKVTRPHIVQMPYPNRLHPTALCASLSLAVFLGWIVFAIAL